MASRLVFPSLVLRARYACVSGWCIEWLRAIMWICGVDLAVASAVEPVADRLAG
jgi:hypothetical protein